MVKVRIKGEDTRKDKDGIVHLSWGEAQDVVAAGAGEIVQGEDVEEPPAGDHETTTTGGTAGEPEGGYESMTRDELDALAADRGVDTTGAKTKADVIDRLRA